MIHCEFQLGGSVIAKAIVTGLDEGSSKKTLCVVAFRMRVIARAHGVLANTHSHEARYPRLLRVNYLG